MTRSACASGSRGPSIRSNAWDKAGDRIIDAQMATKTFYVDKTFMFLQTMFGTNFVDGRIKGYPPAIGMNSLAENKFYAYYVRGNPAYGVNSFADNADGTVTDAATTLMWSKTGCIPRMGVSIPLRTLNFLGTSVISVAESCHSSTDGHGATTASVPRYIVHDATVAMVLEARFE
ncbi:MAG: hypothetical protein WCP28_17170, partial [Actinomycetes bacterium]